MKEKIYISGKITGLDHEEAYKMFWDAQTKYESVGFEVVNPMKLNHDHDGTWQNYMRIDLIEMLSCNHIFMLKGWENSKGANIEYNLARELGFKIIFQ